MPHAEGVFNIPDGLARVEKAPEGIQRDLAPRRLGHIHGKHEPAAAAQQPLDIDEQAVVGVGGPAAAFFGVGLRVLDGQAGNDAVETALVPARQPGTEVGLKEANAVFTGRWPDAGAQLLKRPVVVGGAV